MKQKTVQEISSGGIVFKIEGDDFLWLLIKHAHARHWGFPKGHVADNVEDETLEEAALREVQEEGGIQAAIISKKIITTQYYFKVKDALHKKTVHYFLMQYVTGDTADHDMEVSDSIFVPQDLVIEKLTYKSDREAFKKALLLFSNI